MSELKDLQNLGKTIISNLNQIGISTTRELKNTGAVNVYKKITTKYPNKTWPVCYYLYSIEGALQDKHWDDIGERRKQQLLKEVRNR